MLPSPSQSLSFTVSGPGEVGQLFLPGLGLRIAIPGHPVRLDLDRLADTTLGFVGATLLPILIEVRDVPAGLRFLHMQTSELSGTSPDPKALLEKALPMRARPVGKNAATPAQPEQARSWGVDAAASCVYPLAIPDVHGADIEAWLALCRGRDAVLISQRFSSQRVPWLRWSLFLSAQNAGIRWSADGSALPPAPFPESRFLAPGVTGTLVRERAGEVKELSAILKLRPERREELVRRASQVIRGSEPPATPITAEQRKLYSDYLTKACPTPPQAQRVAALLREVRTAHDLRGAGLMILCALGEEPLVLAGDADE